MIPANPSASYFEGGIVITSILWTVDAGMLLKMVFRSLANIPDGFPFRKILKSGLPFNNRF
ncbi:hypothetical protein D3C85_1725950 [compost metagenome]